MRVLSRKFQATFKSWESLFREAADFATGLGPERLISISHSAEHSEGIVVVWYWGDPSTCPECQYDLTGNASGRCPECGLKI
ncbi:MAG: hypothetical protein IT449_00685 [Phycisphaerales bacterium]|nr:hypothetical protein [Phycisphaerales bacterium]